MAVHAYNAVTGAPEFDDGDAPDIKVDPHAVGIYAGKVGTRVIGTTAERTGYPYSRRGLRWYDTTENVEFVHSGSGWVYADGPDSGWVSCTPFNSNDWSVAARGGYRALSVRRLGREVHLEGVLRWTNSAPTQPGFQGAIVPDGFRPANRYPLSAFAGSLIEVAVSANGEIALGVGTHTGGPRDFVLAGKWFTD